MFQLFRVASRFWLPALLTLPLISAYGQDQSRSGGAGLPWGWPSREAPSASPPSSSSVNQKPAYPLHVLWRTQLPGEIFYAFRQAERSTIQVVGDQLLLGSSRSKGIQILRRRSGSIIGRLSTRGAVEVPLVKDPTSGDWLLGDAGGFVYRMRADGSRVWEHESSGPVLSAPGVGNGKVFYHAIEGSLVALEAGTGKQLWSYRRTGQREGGLAVFGSSIPVVAGELVITGFEDGSVAALKTEDGALIWEKQLVEDSRWMDVDGAPLLLDGDRVVIAAYRGPTVCLSVATGQELWRISAGNSGPILRVGDVLYLPDSEGAVVALSSRTGERLWRWAVPDGQVPNGPIWWRGMLAVTSANGHLYLLNPARGTLEWTFVPDEELAGFSAPATASEDALYLLTDGGYVYALGASDYQPEPWKSERSSWGGPESGLKPEGGSSGK